MVRRRWDVSVSFDGAVLKTVSVDAFSEADAIKRCILMLRRILCERADARDRCPPGGGVHAHVTANLFDPTPVKRGDRDYFVARLPVVGEISYSFDAEHSMPPPLTFQAAEA